MPNGGAVPTTVISKVFQKIKEKRNLILISLSVLVGGVVLATAISTLKPKRPTGPAPSLKIPSPPPKKVSLRATPIESLPGFSATSIVPTNINTLVGVERKTLSLIKITKNSVSTIHPEPVGSYSFDSPLVALLEKKQSEKITIIDISTNKVRSISTTLAPIISIALVPNREEVFFLGKYSPSTRESKLYISSLEGFSPKELLSTKANKVEAISSSKVVLFEAADALDRSTISLFDVENNKTISTSTGNSFFVSPSHEKIAIQGSTSITILNLQTIATKRSRTLSGSVRVGWRDDSSLVILRNKLPGVEIAFLNTDTLESTPPLSIEALSQISAKSLVGIVENALFIEDSDGKLWEILLD